MTQHNQYDIDFLFQRARKRGYVVFVQEADATHRPASGSSTSARRKPGMIPGLRDVTFELAWGASLIEFKPTITTANQISSVTVRGWHRTRKEPITRTVTLDDERITANTDLHRVINACDAREEMVVDEPVFTNCEARERAIAILLDQTKQMVTADVKVVGLPDLRAGQIVVITELGARLSGKYFVTKTTHTIDDTGYLTTFSCRRERAGWTDGTRIYGVVIGVVTDVEDPDGMGRVKLKFPWLSEEAADSGWAPIAAPMAGKERGYYYMPEIDDEALVAFEHGDFEPPDRPRFPAQRRRPASRRRASTSTCAG